MAEVYYVHVLPHCAIGPVAFSACMQVDAAVPNFLMQEQIDACLGNGLLQEDWQVINGHVELPTKPGLGFEINPEEAQQNIGQFVSARMADYVASGNSLLSVNLPHCHLDYEPGSHRLMRHATSRASRVPVMCSAFIARVVRTAVHIESKRLTKFNGYF